MRRFSSLLFSLTVLFLSTTATPQANAQFMWGNTADNSTPVADHLRAMEKQCSNIAKNVQFWLQANGRWMGQPQGNDMAFWVQLDALKDQLRQTRRAADNGDSRKLSSQLTQLQVVAQNTTTLAQRAALDASTIGQLQMMQNNINQTIMIANSAPVVPNNNWNNNGWNNNGWNNNNGIGMNLINAQRISADQVTVSWTLPTGGTATYVSKLNSFMLSDGNSIRPAMGAERTLLQNVYSQAGGMIPIPGGNTGFHPAYSVPGMIQAKSSGKGQFMMMGRVFMNIRNASVESSDPMGHRGTFSIFAGRDSMSFLGTVRAQNQSAVVFNIDGSDRGPASGSLSCTLGFDGSLTAAQGNGILNGQAFIITFKN